LLLFALPLACTSGSGAGATADASPSAPSANPATVLAARADARAPVPASAVRPAVPAKLTPAALAGKELFFDTNLSASKRMSCATCHDPKHAYGPPDDRAVALGGPKGTSSGVRAVPSIRYKEYTPGYADLLDNPDGISVPAPGGGYTWDGRADSLAEQARTPLLSPFEMANGSPADVAREVRASKSVDSFVRAFGPRAWGDAETAFHDVTLALQAFQIEDPSFHPYTSKFDLHDRGAAEGAYTPAEERGFRVFIDPKTGNCAGCHFNGPGAGDGSSGMFTDYSYEAIGVPRNAGTPANRDARYYDMGVCGPLRKDRAPAQPVKPATGESASPFCGLFKTPTLRNAATRHAFFHNGVIRSLEQAVRFYNTRDTMPELWYPTIGGKRKAPLGDTFPAYGLVMTEVFGGVVQKFDDLPAPYRANIDRQMPLDGRAAGSDPPMTEREVSDLVCFLETLTDDYEPAPPPASDRCRD
jgi:cytochrome c peroxidase